MKTRILIVFSVLLSGSIFSQSVTVRIDSLNKVAFQDGKQPLRYDSLTNGDKTKWDTFVVVVKSNSKATINPLKSISLIDGVFFIQGQTGFAKAFKVSSLTGAHLTIKNNFYAFVQAAFGSPLTTLEALFDGTKSIKINGIIIDTETANTNSGGLVNQAETMCLDLLNGATP